MSIVFDATGDYLSRSSNLLDYSGVYTVCLRIFMTAFQGSDFNGSIYIIYDGGTEFDMVGMNGGGGIKSEVGFNAVTGSTLSLNTWYDIAMVRASDTDLSVYVNGTLDVTNTTSVAARTNNATVEYVCQSGFGGGGPVCRIADIILYSTNLSAAQIQQQRGVLRPIENPRGFYPMFSGSGERVRDYSGNGLTWTENGTLTEGDPPPVSWGAPSYAISPVAAAAATGQSLILGDNLSDRIFGGMVVR